MKSELTYWIFFRVYAEKTSLNMTITRSASRIVNTASHLRVELCQQLDVDVRDWALDDPDGTDEDEARRIRAEVRENVSALFAEFEAELG